LFSFSGTPLSPYKAMPSGESFNVGVGVDRIRLRHVHFLQVS